MLTNFDFLQTGRMFPPVFERKRLKRYMGNKWLFEGEHRRVFKELWVRLFRTGLEMSIEMVLNWPKRLSTLWADLLFGETPIITAASGNADETVYIRELIAKTHFWQKMYSAVIDTSRFGDAVCKVRRNDRGEVILNIIPPYYWFPVVDADDAQKVAADVLMWTSAGLLDDEDENGNLITVHVKDPKMYAEIHTADEIRYLTYQLPPTYSTRSGGILGNIIEESTEKNPIGRPLIVHIANLIRSDSLYGVDDYDDLTSLLQELEVRFAQVARILDQHADPKMTGPDLNTAVDSITGETRVVMGNYIPRISTEEPEPKYITWEANIPAAFSQIEALMQQFYMLSETSPAVFGDIQNGTAESGSALRRQMMTPLAKVNRVRMGFDSGIKELLKTMSLLDSGKEIEANIVWQDGLPNDESEEMNMAVLATSNDLISKRTARMHLYGMNEAESNKEDEIIKDEQKGTISSDFHLHVDETDEPNADEE